MSGEVNTAEARAARFAAGLTVCPRCADTGSIIRVVGAGGAYYGTSTQTVPCFDCGLMGNPKRGTVGLKGAIERAALAVRERRP